MKNPIEFISKNSSICIDFDKIIAVTRELSGTRIYIGPTDEESFYINCSYKDVIKKIKQFS